MSKPIIGPKQRTDEWYALRRNAADPKFGGTDAAGLIGVSKWKSPRHIYEEFFTPQERIDNDAMRVGRVMERPICELYAEDRQQLVVHGLPCVLSPDKPLFASLDAMAFPSTPCIPGVVTYDDMEYREGVWERMSDDTAVEVKWSMSPAVAAQLGEEGSDWAPNEWACQVQQQMAVIELKVAEIAVFIFGKLKIYRVPRNNDLIDAISDAAQEMRERVLNLDPPDPDYQHELTPELVRSMRHDIEGGEIVLPDDVAALWERQREIGQQITALTKERKSLQARVEMELVSNEVAAGILPDGVKQVVRREMSRKDYTVEPCTFWELREMKVK